MNEIQLLTLLLSAIAGSVIGMVFFGGLWWTVYKGMASRYAALWFTGSLIVRVGVAVAGFYFIGRGDWRRLLACLCGFVLARVVVMRLTGSRLQHPASSSTGVHHAP
ncbi:F1/F0 ATPase, subunit 2 [Neorhodopirellula lusitana]|uniref:F1/F0 ATPase, subunit 2 n=1 Tax=Neorhodopirellula lusitana TaxID=445327 RepID=A0ABY1PS01_9BACT|nr:ATP synthase subunit I [Neorhodopirellula lusitana]SMP43146.1 F1/F0 ATPase, subunit 2 [Neorhodopirellula lusitana]